ncbi:3-isopropylmalate dehydratase small subunit [Streptomyces lincolnensis]|uniref:3-isopropylmalate dehydratase small subunit n=1 Tax=Streptomyces lincolnensis TaxID=1915 RepID=UPI001E516CEE|nr:3-isopropylmalate dehydratase small subunit [Streptomyces lincolnensis]MCD7440821.1 3-isopropylmalate dehydratase small subunit [Streptomyces lincolnensis]
MDPFTTHTGIAAPLRLTNVDTDQLVPARFGIRTTRTGWADALLADKRSDPDFVLNHPVHRTATILLAGSDFGTGSSREMAVWALLDHGFRAVVAPRYGDIFRGNALKNGLPAVTLAPHEMERLWELVEREPTCPVTVDLERSEVRGGDLRFGFTLDDHSRWRLLNGVDDIALTLRHSDAIDRYERGRRHTLPTTRPRGEAGAR